MAGCFDNSPYDRYLEREVDRYLDEQEEYEEEYASWCAKCEEQFKEYELEEKQTKCEICGRELQEIVIEP